MPHVRNKLYILPVLAGNTNKSSAIRRSLVGQVSPTVVTEPVTWGNGEEYTQRNFPQIAYEIGAIFKIENERIREREVRDR